MKCVNANKLSAFLDGELASEERALIQKHLEDCPHCRKRASEYRAVWEMLDSMESLEPVPLPATGLGQVAQKRQKRERLEHFFIPLITSAAAVISLFVGSFLGRFIYAEFSGGTTTVASASGAQTASSYENYPDAQTMEFYNTQEGGY